jgi:sugar lactone lactonase YvrE
MTVGEHLGEGFMKNLFQASLLSAVISLALVTTAASQQLYATSETLLQLDLVTLPVGTVTKLFTTPGKPDSVLLNAQGQLIYTMSPQGTVALFDPVAGTNTILLSGLKSPRDLLFDPGSTTSMLISEYSIGTILRYNFVSGTSTVLAKKLGSVDGLAYDPQGDLFAIANHNTIVQLDPNTGAILKTLVLETHYKVNGGDGMVYDPYTQNLWVSHDGANATTGAKESGFFEIPTDLSGFTLFQDGTLLKKSIAVPVPDGIVSDGKGNLYVGAGLQRLVVYNIPTDTVTLNPVVPGIDSLILVPGSY